jgi:hypothetical protein
MGRGDGSFWPAHHIPVAPPAAPLSAGGPHSVAIVELNGDGKPEILTGNTNTSNGECDHIGDAMLWLQTFAAGNPRTSSSYAVRSAASAAASVNGETKILVIRLEPIADRIEIF